MPGPCRLAIQSNYRDRLSIILTTIVTNAVDIFGKYLLKDD